MSRKIRKIIEKTLTGRARINEYKDSFAKTEEVQERKRARVERGVEWRADGGSTCGRISKGKKKQHEENRMRGYPKLEKKKEDRRQQIGNNLAI